MRIRLVHWNADEARERAQRLQALGHEVQHKPLDGAGLRRLREDPPDALVIDLTRLPSQGRDLAVSTRTYKATRHVPLVFVDGTPEKAARVRALLPDAVFCRWDEIDGVLPEAVAHPPPHPVVPKSLMAGYSGKPLVQKLGIKAHSAIALFGAPHTFEETLGDLPEGVEVQREPAIQCDLTLWFVRAQEEMEREIERIGALAEERGLWVAWPKKSSGIASDLSQAIVRRIGLESGLVDYKVCSIDTTWSGLLFTQRRRGGKRSR